MKVELKEKNSESFNPFTLTLKFETQQDANIMLCLLDRNDISAELVNKEIEVLKGGFKISESDFENFSRNMFDIIYKKTQ